MYACSFVSRFVCLSVCVCRWQMVDGGQEGRERREGEGRDGTW